MALRNLLRKSALLAALAATPTLAPNAKAAPVVYDCCNVSSENDPTITGGSAFVADYGSSQFSLEVFTGLSYNIDSVYFNTSNNITGLSLASAPTGTTLQTNQAADGLGVYDWFLSGWNPAQNLQFLFDVQGTNVLLSDFFSHLSTNPPGSQQGAYGLKLFQGDQFNDPFRAGLPDSQWGAQYDPSLPPGTTIPEPGTLSLFGLGLLALGYGMRQRSNTDKS